MKLDKLVRQLRRDLVANPKKAAALGLMLLVAGYFWAPLAWGWLTPRGKTTAKAESNHLILEDDPAQPTTSGKANSPANFRWEKVRQLLLADPRMKSATYEISWRDPFALPPTEQQSEASDAEATAAGETQGARRPSAAVDPERAGLKLASVAIGPRGRSAIISGETYHEGDSIQTTATDKSKPGTTPVSSVTFVIRRIDRQGVELESQGKAWRLEFNQRRLAQGDEIERAPTSEPR